jgi:hypothetical protein
VRVGVWTVSRVGHSQPELHASTGMRLEQSVLELLVNDNELTAAAEGCSFLCGFAVVSLEPQIAACE